MKSLSNTSKPVHLPTRKVQWNYTAKCGHINKGCSGTQDNSTWGIPRYWGSLWQNFI